MHTRKHSLLHKPSSTKTCCPAFWKQHNMSERLWLRLLGQQARHIGCAEPRSRPPAGQDKDIKLPGRNFGLGRGALCEEGMLWFDKSNRYAAAAFGSGWV